MFWNIDGQPSPEVERSGSLGDIDDPGAYPGSGAGPADRDPVLTGEDARVSLAINSSRTWSTPSGRMAIYESSRTGREVFRAP